MRDLSHCFPFYMVIQKTLFIVVPCSVASAHYITLLCIQRYNEMTILNEIITIQSKYSLVGVRWNYVSDRNSESFSSNRCKGTILFLERVRCNQNSYRTTIESLNEHWAPVQSVLRNCISSGNDVHARVHLAHTSPNHTCYVCSVYVQYIQRDHPLTDESQSKTMHSAHTMTRAVGCAS